MCNFCNREYYTAFCAKLVEQLEILRQSRRYFTLSENYTIDFFHSGWRGGTIIFFNFILKRISINVSFRGNLGSCFKTLRIHMFIFNSCSRVVHFAFDEPSLVFLSLTRGTLTQIEKCNVPRKSRVDETTAQKVSARKRLISSATMKNANFSAHISAGLLC